MKLGITMFPTHYAMPVPEMARAVEDLGFESLSFPEHTHIPTSRRTPYPAGGELPTEYSHTLDPFVAMTARRQALAEIEAAGASRAVFFMPPEPVETVLSQLRHCAQVAGLWRGADRTVLGARRCTTRRPRLRRDRAGGAELRRRRAGAHADRAGGRAGLITPPA